MSHDLKVEKLIACTPAEAFDAFVDPDAMKEWYQDNPGWNVDVLSCDVRPRGTTIVAFGPDAVYKEEMTYSVVERPQKLVYAETFSKPDGSSFNTVVTITFEAQDEKTLLSIVQTGFPNAEERDGHQGGWPGFIDRLERVITVRRAA